MVRLKARCRNRLDFEHYFLRQKCFGWHTLLLQADFHNLSLRRFTEYFYFVSKHLRHFTGSTEVLGWKPFTVNMGEVQGDGRTVA